MNYEPTKEIWDKLKNIYQGDTKVQKEKIQTYRTQFEGLKMKEEEDIAAYFQRVEEVVNTMRGLGEEVQEASIAQNVLRSLSPRLNSKLSSIEDKEILMHLSWMSYMGSLLPTK